MSKYILDFEAPLRDSEEKIETLKSTALKTGMDVSSQINQLILKHNKLKSSVYSNLSRWEKVQLARHPKRPHTSDFINSITDEWIEIHGDRLYSDDKAIIAGMAKIEGHKVIIIGQEKGKTTKEKLFRNFGMPRPEGYRKALRIMKLAEKFNIPIITLIDTIGAYPGLGAEERGQAEAIAKNLFEMALLKVPTISIVIGEGASGGALGIGVTDKIACLENTWYSVISPEGCASILFRDASRAEQAADAMKVTAKDIKEMGICDDIIEEPLGGAHHNFEQISINVKKYIIEKVIELTSIPINRLVDIRINKYQTMGAWEEID
ncbi:MAG: acetyl-CoA carboxylase carboxyl transferase subunit alpha [Candidatus Marinimicrobia bacterium]|nr:acetyl-CoA carboxylase carboxyl transferase subunit alpha [Candidatus Neomarinimicrobiota bacterium]|tara:strand:+ start:930 stop:1892 length:963 start_codon:yes stop_codon:yes gene_type:complete